MVAGSSSLDICPSTPSTSVRSEALSKLIDWGPTYPFHAGRVGRAWTTPVVLGRHTRGPGLSRHRRAHLLLQNTFHFMAVGKMGVSSSTALGRFLLHQRNPYILLLWHQCKCPLYCFLLHQRRFPLYHFLLHQG